MKGSFLFACVSFSLVSICVSAEDSATADNSPNKPVAGTTAQTQMRAYVDPATGRLIPISPAQRTPTEFQSDPSKVTHERRADGTEIDYLNGQGQQAIVARRGKDGKLQLICTDAAEAKIAAPLKDQSNDR